MYVDYGYGLAVAVLDSGLIVEEWLGEDETASEFPLPTHAECDGARAVLRKMQSVILARDACAASRQTILEMYDAVSRERDSAQQQLARLTGKAADVSSEVPLAAPRKSCSNCGYSDGIENAPDGSWFCHRCGDGCES